MIDNFEEDLKKEIEERGGAKQVMSQEVAYLISDILSGVLRGGTATSAMYEAKFTRMGAGKTGTSNDWKDAWFVGYTPETRYRNMDWFRFFQIFSRKQSSWRKNRCANLGKIYG